MAAGGCSDLTAAGGDDLVASAVVVGLGCGNAGWVWNSVQRDFAAGVVAGGEAGGGVGTLLLLWAALSGRVRSASLGVVVLEMRGALVTTEGDEVIATFGLVALQVTGGGVSSLLHPLPHSSAKNAYEWGTRSGIVSGPSRHH